MADLCAGKPPKALGIAVSGGSDSTALMHLMSDWCAPRTIPLCVATVDHKLRPESAGEARTVRRMAEGLGLGHATLVWDGYDGQGNTQGEARNARYGLLADWARGLGLEAVATGHTADDQAETVLMNLARGSGVDGLSGIARAHTRFGVRVIRPLLGLGRSDLRAWLQGRSVGWIEDPSNEDQTYQRVRARKALEALAPLGITTRALEGTAQRMSAAREVLEGAAAEAAERVTREDAGDIVIRRRAFLDLPRELRGRLLAGALVWVASARFRPRAAALEGAERMLAMGKATTLHGCLIYPHRGETRVTREAGGTLAAPLKGGAAIWDTRWDVKAKGLEGAEVRALGEAGLKQLGRERPKDPPRRTLAAAPSLWRDGQLLACPHAAYGPEYNVKLTSRQGPFAASLLSR